MKDREGERNRQSVRPRESQHCGRDQQTRTCKEVELRQKEKEPAGKETDRGGDRK